MIARSGICWILAVGLSLCGGCDRSPPSAAASGRLTGRNVLLITLDTTRADRLGCYGHASARTPALDALAGRGAMFLHAYSQVPLTLPSHSVLMTGRYPRELGVRNNGRDVLSPSHPTLASVLRKEGYRTGAFVSSFVLDSRFGLDPGFEVYDDDMGHQRAAPQQLRVGAYVIDPFKERSAGEVTDRALAWLRSNERNRFFCWVHYYDPHDPYEPPAEFRKLCRDRYDGELAYVDTQVKRVLDWLETAGLTDHTLIIVVGDHGEAFGEHGEHGHSMFLYDTNLHVPLFFVAPKVITGARRVDTTVELVDVMPTVLELLGAKTPEGLSSRSLAPALFGRQLDARDSYAESLFLFDAFGWAEQRAVVTPRWKYISSTRPELFDRQSDPQEKVNLVATHPDTSRELAQKLTEQFLAMEPGRGGTVQLDAAARRALESLGYVGGGGQRGEEQFLSAQRGDPKELLPIIKSYEQARKLIREKETDEAISLLVPAVQQSPLSRDLRYLLGICYLGQGQVEQAMAEFEATARIDPTYAPVLLGMGDVLARRGELLRAVEHYRAALALDDLDPIVHTKLAMALKRLGQVEGAQAEYARALEIEPDYAEACYEMGIISADRGQLDDAVRYYQRALVREADHPETQYNLGLALLRLGRLAEAVQHLQEAVRLRPDYGDALNNLGIALAKEGARDQAKVTFERATQIESAAAEAYYNLGVTAANEGKPAEAIASYERALELRPAYARPAEVLAGIYLADHRPAEAIRVLRIGVAHSPDHVAMTNSLSWLLATCARDDLRDGAAALRLAQHAAELTGPNHPDVLRTLAAAYAETRDFERAAETARKAVDLAEAAGRKELAASVRAEVEQYLAGQAQRVAE